ncbi:MAG: hypothetical protein JXA18_17150 [Chitinispirillaceae bacterium]|nr:hypothetical protein [Chitinispirillaceae bacterium]
MRSSNRQYAAFLPFVNYEGGHTAVRERRLSPAVYDLAGRPVDKAITDAQTVSFAPRDRSSGISIVTINAVK